MNAHVSVSLGPERYAIAVQHVSEVMDVERIVPVPGAARVLAGIAHARGEILPVISLHHLVGAPTGDPTRMVIVRDGDRRAGLPVDGVATVADLHAADDHSPDELTTLDIPAILDAVARAR